MSAVASNFPCNTCSLTFASSKEQRDHMRSDQHILHLRERVARVHGVAENKAPSQAASQEFPSKMKTKDSSRSAAHNVPPESTTDSRTATPEHTSRHCLFCNLPSSHVEINYEHMSTAHSFYIPSIERLSDLETFLGYLGLVVFSYDECIYCGLSKNSPEAIQAHMRDTGHCMLNLQEESELLDFWESSDTEAEDRQGHALKISETEMRLPSGTVIDSRSGATHARIRPSIMQARSKSSQQRSKLQQLNALLPGKDEDQKVKDQTPVRDRHVAMRGEMGLVGISDQQRRALQITEHKIKRREALVKSAQRHAMEQQPKKTIYYKTENPVYQAG